MYCTYQGSIKSVDIGYFNNYIPREEEREYEIHIFLNFPVPNDYKWDKEKNSWTDCELGSDTWRNRNSKFFREAMKQKQQFWNDIEGWVKTEIKDLQEVHTDSNVYWVSMTYFFRTRPITVDELVNELCRTLKFYDSRDTLTPRDLADEKHDYQHHLYIGTPEAYLR